MKSFQSFITEEEKEKSGKEIKSGKNSIKINPDSESLKEAEIQPPAERLGAVTAIPQKERDAARERLLAKTKAAREKRMKNEAKWYDPMEDPDFDPREAEKKRGVSGKNNPKKGKPVKIEESDYWHPDPKKDRALSNRGAKLRAREDGKTSTAVSDDSNRLRPGESYMDYAKRKGGSMSVKKKPSGIRNKLKSVLGLKNSYEVEGEMIEEGMSMKDFKANRRKLKRQEASTDAKKRGHVGKEWYNSGRTYSPDEAKRSRANMDDDERRTRHRSAVDPDNEDDNNYSADRTKNPKKQRKQAAMGEQTMMSFSQFMEARRMDKEGVDRGDSGRAERAAKARESLAAKAKRQKVLDKHEKQTGNKLDISRSKEGREHAKNFPGSRQAPKVKGAKETPSETQNRRINASNQRKIKHGFTSKERKEAESMAKHTSARD